MQVNFQSLCSTNVEGAWPASQEFWSSPAEVTMQLQNRKRVPAWTDQEVLDLITVWGDESVLSELRSKRRNAKIYEKISKARTERGYSWDATQCRVKIKELRQGYQKTKESNGRSGSQPQTCRFYEALHSILGAAATTTPPLTVDSEDGILSTPASSDMLADGEDEEGDEEDEAVDSPRRHSRPSGGRTCHNTRSKRRRSGALTEPRCILSLTALPRHKVPSPPHPKSQEGGAAGAVKTVTPPLQTAQVTEGSHSQRFDKSFPSLQKHLTQAPVPISSPNCVVVKKYISVNYCFCLLK
uniref:Myb/SANT-like DNA-binding domain-containing protein n=1 Tax=Chrysemys picta bellii TaxID=8478 RepID=A0A8C3HSJ7_CHRPI